MTDSIFDPFAAAAAAPDDDPAAAGEAGDVDDASRRLLDAIAHLEDQMAQVDAADEDAPDEPTRTRLASLCAAPDAPLQWRSMLERVERGTLTWHHVWQHPRDEGPAGVALVRTAVTGAAQDAVLVLQMHEEELTERGDAVAREALRSGHDDPGGAGAR